MAKQRQEDLFAESTMTFGEHLEELRKALILALGGLMVGFLIGLVFATNVVEAIKLPLEKALKQFYIDKAMFTLDREYAEDVDVDVETFIREKQFVPNDFYIELPEIQRLRNTLGQHDEQPNGTHAPQPTKWKQESVPAPHC